VTALLAAARAVVYAAGFFVVWGWLALGVRRWDRLVGVALPEPARPLGAVFMAVGLLLGVICVGAFASRGLGTPAPFDPPRRFVVWGPYRWVRNPMYWGGLTILLGFGLWHRSAAMVLFTLPAALAAHVFVVLVEERGLARRFGEDYAAYCAVVNRWVPRRPQRQAPRRSAG